MAKRVIDDPTKGGDPDVGQGMKFFRAWKRSRQAAKPQRNAKEEKENPTDPLTANKKNKMTGIKL
jgi:hypothetical protein